MSGQPTVSVVLPTFQERTCIVDCLTSLVAQDDPRVLEILVVDGGSTDGTLDLVLPFAGKVRVLHNPKVTAAAAMNLGIERAHGDVIVRADAHTIYASDYVRRCVDLLIETGADNVGGRMRPVGTTSFGRAVAAVTSSPLGVGPGAFHYLEERADVDTVYLGTWWRSTLVRLGGFDTDSLQWAAEDHELNLRITRGGGRIVLDPDIRSWYFPRETVRSLGRQYRNYGLGKASTLAKHRTLPTWRPLVPAGLVVATVLAAVLPLRPRALRVLPPVAHAAAVAAASLRLGRDPGVAPHRAFGAMWLCHWAYGLGLLQGLGRIVRRRPFDRAPKGRR